jgi:hypothetical protein
VAGPPRAALVEEAERGAPDRHAAWLRRGSPASSHTLGLGGAVPAVYSFGSDVPGSIELPRPASIELPRSDP